MITTASFRRPPDGGEGPSGRLPRLSLRARTALALAVGALALSSVIALAGYQVARRIELAQQRESLRAQALLDAAGIARAAARRGATSPRTEAQRARVTLARQTGAETYLVFDSGRVAGDGDADARLAALPDELFELARERGAAEQLLNDGNGPRLAVAVRLDPPVAATFVEVARLDRVERYQRRLASALSLAVVASAAGGAALGWAMSGRVMRPLAAVSDAARRLADGRLDTRLPLTGDRDLDPLIGSFNEMAESLTDRIQREARFASDVSHELRTPLTSLATAVKLLESRRDEMGERSQKALDVLAGQTAHFERLVLDLLEISRFDAGAADLHVDSVDIVELVQQVLATNGAADIPVSAGPGTLERRFVVDKRRVERMLANLIQNAELYASGATAVGVSLVEAGPPARLRFTVDDCGPGVDPEERLRIFERFNRGRAHATRSGPKGSGLGLALVAEHASLHGGRAWVEDRPGGPGARFVVEIVEGTERSEQGVG